MTAWLHFVNGNIAVSWLTAYPSGASLESKCLIARLINE
ncbi:hypothetical protein JCM19238_4065 [Vibrio ponticus]|nr:hypothetical protein JCM19238_4065 [Vibrio ponticus]